MNVLIPENLNVSKLKYPDEIAMLCDMIAEQRVLHKELRKPNTLVPLNATVLRKILGRHRAKPAIEEALANNIVYRSNSYCPDNYSKGYMLGPEYDRRKGEFISINNERLGVLQAERDAEFANTEGFERWLKGWVRLLEFDRPITNGMLDEICVDDNEEHNKFMCAQKSVRKILDKQFFHEFCRNGRLHTNMTNIKRELRKYLTIMGSSLVYLDISCAQPLFFGLYLVKNFPSLSNIYKQTNQTNQPTNHNQPHNHPNQPQPTNPLPNQQSPPSLCWPPIGKVGLVQSELDKYLEMVQSGQFYEQITSCFGMSRQKSKDDWKIFAYGKTHWGTRMKACFKRELYSLFVIIENLKHNDYRDFANLLQQMESEFVIQTCCRRLFLEYPSLPVITIHDSIGTTVGNEHIVEQIIREEFNKLGLGVTLKREG